MPDLGLCVCWMVYDTEGRVYGYYPDEETARDARR